MIPLSSPIVLISLFAGVISLIIFMVALARGAFERPHEQSMMIFDELDLRHNRPWETEEQKQERVRLYGSLIEPRAGEWGGCS